MVGRQSGSIGGFRCVKNNRRSFRFAALSVRMTGNLLCGLRRPELWIFETDKKLNQTVAVPRFVVSHPSSKRRSMDGAPSVSSVGDYEITATFARLPRRTAMRAGSAPMPITGFSATSLSSFTAFSAILRFASAPLVASPIATSSFGSRI